jgi:exopolysaccharide production protein ExoZ
MGVSVMPAFSVGGVGVDILFVISGFIMVYVSAPMPGQAGAPRVFLLRRICRIVPLYWAAITLYVMIVMWALARAGEPLTP